MVTQNEQQSPGDPVNTEYFTSFEQTGKSDFLSYIPWIRVSIFKVVVLLQQNDGQARSGTYSALFTDHLRAEPSEIETQHLPIPPDAFEVTMGGWFFVAITNITINVTIVIDNQTNTTKWSFSDDDAGKWVYRNYTVALPENSAVFYGGFQLNKNNLGVSVNYFWLDDFSVNFY